MVKHRADPTPSVRLRRTAGRIGATSGIFAAAIVCSIAAAGGTFALFNSQATLGAGAVTGGTTGLTINDVADYAITGLDTTKLLPGRSVITATPLTVKNTGNTPLNVTQGAATFSNPSSTLASNLVVVVRQASTCTLTPVGTTPTGMTTPVRLNVGATMTVCVEVQLLASAPSTVSGALTDFTVPLDGIQVRP
jgi:hypothetical protein